MYIVGLKRTFEVDRRKLFFRWRYNKSFEYRYFLNNYRPADGRATVVKMIYCIHSMIKSLHYFSILSIAHELVDNGI